MSAVAAVFKRFLFPRRGCKVANFITSLLNVIFTSSGYLREMRRRNRKDQSEQKCKGKEEGGKVCAGVGGGR